MTWVATYSGRHFEFNNPKPEDISIQDIAHSLSNMCRFNGHCLTYYSVAEHCVLLSRMVSTKEAALFGLLHDAAEAYIGDVVRPLKTEDIRSMENNILEVITGMFMKPVDIETGKRVFDEVRLADDRMLVTEMLQIMPQGPKYKELETTEPYSLRIEGWAPYKAKLEFLNRFKELTRE